MILAINSDDSIILSDAEVYLRERIALEIKHGYIYP